MLIGHFVDLSLSLSLSEQLFTVVRNVKEAHECQEHGETQEFHDDVDYILDGLQCSQPLATRCLRCFTWAFFIWQMNNFISKYCIIDKCIFMDL